MPGTPVKRRRRQMVEAAQRELETGKELPDDLRMLYQSVVEHGARMDDALTEDDPGGRAVPSLDLENLDVTALLPYRAPAQLDDPYQLDRRNCMDELLRSVMLYGKDQLAGIVARLASQGAQFLSLPEVRDWEKGNVDGFADRMKDAHEVFRSRMAMALSEAVDLATLGKSNRRDILALLAVNNAENPERYKRGGAPAAPMDPKTQAEGLLAFADALSRGMADRRALPVGAGENGHSD